MNKSCDRRRSDRKGREKVIYDIHVSRIKAAKGRIDCTPPRPHPFTNKTDMDQRRKLAAIETDNKILLDRLTTIVTSKIDDQTHPLTAVHASFKIDMLRTKKRIETQKITSENQRLLHRIRNCPPAYHHAEWEEHARISERHKKSMSLYPEYYKKSEKSEKDESPNAGFDSATRRLVATGMNMTCNSTDTPITSRTSFSSAPPLSSSPMLSSKDGQSYGQGNLLDMGISNLKICDSFRLPPL